MKLMMVKADKLKPLEGNPRKVKDPGAIEKLKTLIAAHGFQNPLQVWRDESGELVILAGNHRYAAGCELGMTEFPCVEYEGTRDMALARAISDNKSGEWTEWELNGLREMLDGIDDVEMTGFTAGELDDLYGTAPAGGTDGLTDPDDVPDPPAEPVTKPGDIWQLGRHRVMCGDSASVDAASRLMGGGKADMVFTDPPYGVSYTGKTKDALEIENDNLRPAELADAVTVWFSVVDAVTRDGAYLMATVPPGPLHLIFAQDWLYRGWLRQIMVWNKSAMVLGHSEHHYKHEPILFGWKPGDRHKNADRTRTTVWDFDKPTANREHPTMKPVAMWEFGITNHTNPGDLVFEPFGGSGTTLIACEKTGRTCYGMEISPHYCDVIVKRWEDFTGQKAVLL